MSVIDLDVRAGDDFADLLGTAITMASVAYPTLDSEWR